VASRVIASPSDGARDALNIGCGDHRIEGVIGCDIDGNAAAVDVVCDLNVYPYPFADGSFQRIVCRDILEHLDDVPRTIAELHRLLKPGGTVEVRIPHFTSMDAYADPTHRHYLSARSLDFCLEGTCRPGLRTGRRFRLVRRRIVFYRIYRVLGIAAWANRFPTRWEGHLAFIFPAQYVEFSLQALPSGSR